MRAAVIEDADPARAVAKRDQLLAQSIRRSGSPSAVSSVDRQAGSQYWRIRAPIGVPGPTRVSNSFSAAVVVLRLLWCWLRENFVSPDLCRIRRPADGRRPNPPRSA